MRIKYFDAGEAEKFGRSLANLFIKKIPPEGPGDNKKKMAKQLEVVDQMYLQIEQFKKANGLNIYKKAKLGGAFKEEMALAGYPPEFIDQVTKGLMLKL